MIHAVDLPVECVGAGSELGPTQKETRLAGLEAYLDVAGHAVELPADHAQMPVTIAVKRILAVASRLGTLVRGKM